MGVKVYGYDKCGTCREYSEVAESTSKLKLQIRSLYLKRRLQRWN